MMMSTRTGLAVALLVTCCISAAAAIGSRWDQTSRDLILELHNKYRMNAGGCDLNRLEYDMRLEEHAKLWATKCRYEKQDFSLEDREERGPELGQSLMYTVLKDEELKLVHMAAYDWHREKINYQWGAGSCRGACNYTQIVWYDTEKLGCFSTECSPLEGANEAYAWFIVCMYSPRGNKPGEAPFRKKPCKRVCRPGQEVDEEGLCLGIAEAPCRDDKDDCKELADKGECKSSSVYMLTNCRKTCKICTS